MQKNGFMKILRLIQNFIMSQSGKQIITVHIMLNISSCKDNQAMKFGQLIEDNVKNIFLERLYRKKGRETSSRSPFTFQKSFI